jgi:hypothetical protein
MLVSLGRGIVSVFHYSPVSIIHQCSLFIYISSKLVGIIQNAALVYDDFQIPVSMNGFECKRKVQDCQ